MHTLKLSGGRKIILGLVVIALVLMLAGGLPLLAHAQSTTATTPAPAASATTNTSVATVSNCTPSLYNLSAIFSVTCWGRTIGAIIDGILVSVSSWILTLSGNLFNWLLNYTVIQFGGTFYQSIQGAIETAWSAFRDIANIMIIGIFTFIAVSIIAGLQQFGNKRLIAELLIIAVLINFSLLFTKIIIDGSNYTALQIYAASTGQTAAGASATASSASFSCPQGATNSQCYGIAGSFMDYIGVSGFSDTRQAVSNLADSLDDGGIAFLHGLFAAVILLAAAAVLFYGSFLLLSRALLLIFLLVTSSIAVASYLIPAWKNARFGWDKWWASLWRCAVFAPLIMLLLWIDLTVGYALRAHNGTLGDLLAHPTSTPDLSSLVSYCLILGLLFFSFKIANVFATEKTPWFGTTQSLWASPLAYGSSLAWGGGRNLLGRGAALWQERVKKDIPDARGRATRANAWLDPSKFDKLSKSSQQRAQRLAAKSNAELQNLEKLSSRLGTVRDSKFDPLKTKLGGNVLKQLGVAVPGGKSESFGTKADRIAKDAAARAEKAALLSDKDKEKKRPEAEREARLRHADEKRRAEDDKRAREAQLKTAEDTLKAVRDSDEHRAQQSDKQLAQTKVDTLKKDQARQIESMVRAKSPDAEIRKRQEEHKAALRTEEAKIESARNEINRLEGDLPKQVEQHKDAIDKLGKTIADHEDSDTSARAIKDLSEKVLKEWSDASAKVAAETAEKIAHGRATNFVPRALQEESGNDYTSRLARGLVEDHVREKKSGGDILKALKAQIDAGASPAPAATPPSTPSSGTGH